MVTIKHRDTGEALVDGDFLNIKLAVEWVVNKGYDLREADLRGADLRGANLGDADFAGADFAGADFAGADLSGADLCGANLGDADFAGADIGDADLSGTCLLDGGQRSDGSRFIGWVKDGVLQILEDSRNFTIEEARKHWSSEDYGDRKLGDETLCILDHIERVAVIRGLAKESV